MDEFPTREESEMLSEKTLRKVPSGKTYGRSAGVPFRLMDLEDLPKKIDQIISRGSGDGDKHEKL